MSSREATITEKPPDPRSREGKNTTAAAGVEIVGFPQILYTRTFGDPDMFFVPLLDAAREAYRMIERLSTHGEDRANAVRLSAMQLISTLLRDSSFSLVVKGMTNDNLYTVDLDAGILRMQTRLFAIVSRRTSFFKIEMAGKISEGLFVVRSPVQGPVVAQVEDEKLRRPNFFSTTLAQECLRAQMEQESFGRLDETSVPEGQREIRMFVTVKGVRVPVVLRQKEEKGSWDIVDGRRQEWVGTLTPEVEGPLGQVIAFVQDLFAQK
jgi:hypothetical protein